jgi:hypothetical protein
MSIETGMELMEKIAELSAKIAEYKRMGASTVNMEVERERLRKEFRCIPDLTFT